MNNKVVIFTDNNARILSNPPNLEELQQLPNAILNPDLSLVKGVAPHLWALKDGKVLPLTKEEQEKRISYHNKIIVNNKNILKFTKRTLFAQILFKFKKLFLSLLNMCGL